MKKCLLFLFPTLILMLSGSNAYSTEKHAHGDSPEKHAHDDSPEKHALGASHSQGAHTHGSAAMTIAAEGNHLEIFLESPAINIVGFEHQASTNEQRRHTDKVEKQLMSTERLFQFKGAQCVADKIEVDLSAVRKKEHKHHKGEHASHKTEQEVSHSDVTASYHFRCKNTGKLTTISIDLLDQFKGIEKLKTTWITEKKQGSETLTVQSKVIRLD